MLDRAFIFRRCAAASALLMSFGGCDYPATQTSAPGVSRERPGGPAPSETMVGTADLGQVAALEEKLQRWRETKLALTALDARLSGDRERSLRELDSLGMNSIAEIEESPKAAILADELRDVSAQRELCRKKLERYELAIFRVEAELRSLERTAAARSVGLEDQDFDELTRTVIELEETLAAEDPLDAVISEFDTEVLDELQALRRAAPSSPDVVTSTEEAEVGGPSAGATPDPLVSATAVPDAGTLNRMSLFDGQTMNGWKPLFVPYSKTPRASPWRVDASAGVLYSVGGDWVDLKSDETYRDFRFSFEWRFRPGGPTAPNGSGVIVRARSIDRTVDKVHGVVEISRGPDAQGIEIDLRPTSDRRAKTGTGCFIAYETQLFGVTPDEVKAGAERHFDVTRPPHARQEGWNECSIECQRDSILFFMNGDQVSSAWGAEDVAGHLVLRSQNTAVEFRRLFIEEFVR